MALKKIFLTLLFFTSMLAGGVIALAYSDSAQASPPSLQAADASGGDAKFAKSPNPILMAGTPNGAWLAIPRVLIDGAKKLDVAEFWYHNRFMSDAGNDVWRQASFEGSTMFARVPQSLAVASIIENGDDGRANERQFAWILFDKNRLNYFTGKSSHGSNIPLRGYNQDPTKPDFPLAGECITATGSRVFLLARGPLSMPKTQPAQPTQPATTGSAPTTAASGPSLSIAPAPDEVWQMYQHTSRVSEVEELPSLGKINIAGETPSGQARIAMAATPVQLTVAWREPNSPRLFIRTLAIPRKVSSTTSPESKPAATWSATTTIDLAAQDAGDPINRLLAANIDNRAVIAWVTQRDATKPLELRGVVVNNDGKVANESGGGKIAPIFPMNLGPKSESVNPNDVAFAQSGTAVIVAFSRPDGKIYTNLFPTYLGVEKENPTTSTATNTATNTAVLDIGREWQETSASNPKRTDTQLVQNIMVILVAILIVACLFQFRKRPPKVSIPKGRKLASLQHRIYGAAIDLALPLAAVVLYTGEFTGTLQALVSATIPSPETFITHPEIIWIIGLYFLHVTIGELATGRSIGKAFAGTQVISSDGYPASKAAIFLRNFVKIFELSTSGLLLFYMLINPFRQRLGDFFAHTIVLDTQPVDPNDPEVKKREREEEAAGKK